MQAPRVLVETRLWMKMDHQQQKGKEKVHYRDSTSEDSVQTCKRIRQPIPETMPADVPEQQNPHAFWKIRDKEGWKHGIMIDPNRQHWQCRYCSVPGYSGGISGLKRHLVGNRRANKCTAVSEDVSAEVKYLMDVKKERRQERAALKALNNPALITSSESWHLIPSTPHGLISDVQKDCSSILRESTQASMVWAHVPGGTCYCSFCTLERAEEGPDYEEMRLGLLHRKIVQVVDMMLSAAEQLSVEEQSLTMTE